MSHQSNLVRTALLELWILCVPLHKETPTQYVLSVALNCGLGPVKDGTERSYPHALPARQVNIAGSHLERVVCRH